MSNLTEAILAVLNREMNQIHTQMPARVESYNSKQNKVAVFPLIKRDNSDGTTTSWPVIANVPVIFPRTSTFMLRFPINRGDYGLILFSEQSLEKWLSLGGESESGDPRRFDLSDGMFLPGLYPFSESIPISGNNSVEMKYKKTSIRITNDGNVEVGETNFKKLVNEEFQDLFNNHVHYISVAGTPAAQTGVSSSPSKLAGTIPLRVSAVAPGTPHLFNDDITSSELTSKTEAQ